jgi:hypothetical protein
MQSADRWLPPNPVMLSKGACRRTVKVNMTWEGKGLGKGFTSAYSDAVLSEGFGLAGWGSSLSFRYLDPESVNVGHAI